MSRSRVALAVLLASIYALCYSAIKTGLALAPPLRFAGLRAGLAAIILFALLAGRRRKVLPPAGGWRWILGLAIASGAEYGAMFHAPGHTGAGIASVLGNTGPLMVVVLAAVVLGEPITRVKLISLSLGLAGISLIAYPAITDPAQAGVQGTLLPLTAAAGASLSSVLFKRMRAGDALLAVAAWQLLLAAAAILGTSFWVERGAMIVWSGGFWLLLVALGVSTAFAQSLWYWLVQREEVGRLSVYLFLIPFFGLLLAWLFFDEQVGVFEATGIAVTLSAILLALAHR